MSEGEQGETKKQVDAHLLAVGRCINQWAQLEMQLFAIFSAALATRDDFAAIIFYRDHAFRSKLKLTEEIVEAALSGPTDKSRWLKLCKQIGDGSEYRNRAAHFALWRQRHVTIGPEGVTENSDTGLRAAKTPQRLKRPREKDAHVDVPGLEASVRAAAALHHELAEFGRLLTAQDPHRLLRSATRRR
ncbi:hypothetical protein [Arvimicrobium flavum]|uniref:hypothetical protein n=1 Tax=Arvimicrobium flavum TaxID=3393320 RepID=UPI00237AE29C|nr:hypothetical protein [Mesorhizobium shangrilense]